MNFLKDKNFSELNPERGVSLIITFFTAFYKFFVGRVRATNNIEVYKTLRSERGVSLIITFFIMIVILTIVSSLSIILYSEVKVMRNMGNSVVSFYAAESGIEKVLYYDRQVLPIVYGDACSSSECPTGQSCVYGYCAMYAPRGLCSMFDSVNNSYGYCNSQLNSGYDGSVYCNNPKPDVADFNGTCSPSNCTDCTISFTTKFDNNSNYNITAIIKANGDFEVNSEGIFGDTQRKINILIVDSASSSPLPPPTPLSNVNGLCGLANGVDSASAPMDNLCEAGTPSVVTQQGYSWVWTCDGSGENYTNDLCSASPPCSILDTFASDWFGPTISSAGVVLNGNGVMTISADVTGDIDYVQAIMYAEVDGNCINVTQSIDLLGSGTYSEQWWNGIVGTTYYILIDARDSSLKHTYLRIDPVLLYY